MFQRALLWLSLTVGAVWIACALLLRCVPLPEGLNSPPPEAVQWLDRHGQLLRETSTEELTGQRLPLHELPQSLIHATLAAEDHRFWNHDGWDPLANVRAAFLYVKHRRIISGASTITQQLIKMSEPRPRTFATKAVELVQAMRLEQIWGKERILEEYLNRLDYGNLRRGCSSASQYYFDLPASALSTAQSAFLAGLPQAPTRLNPHRNFARAKQRQEWILGQMHAHGYLTRIEYERALAEPIRLAPRHLAFHAPHFVDLLIQQHPNLCNQRPQAPIVTSVDLALNTMATKILQRQIECLRSHHVRNGAVVVIENSTGQVLALVGSENYFEPDAGQVNGAWAPRSAGSTFKPFTYLLALEQGATPASVVADIPTDFPTPTGVFTPLNYNRHCLGPVRYRPALANSLNIPAVKVLDDIGGPSVLLERMRELQLTTLDQDAAFYGLGLTIGNAEARLLELANAYACLARLGEFRPYSLLAPGQIAKTQRMFDPTAAYLLADILSDNTARAIAFGMDSPLRFDFPVACKTGTSTSFRDNWAFGYTPEYTAGVWVGNFDGSPMNEVSGVTGAAPILHELCVHLHDRYGTSWYQRPANVMERFVHPITGKLLANAEPGAVKELFDTQHLPPMASPSDSDNAGRVYLPESYREWMQTSDNWLAGRVVLENRRPHSEDATISFEDRRLAVLHPQPGSVFFLDADLPDRGSVLPLRVMGAQAVNWHSATLHVETNGLRSYARMIEGRHELTAVDSLTGMQATTWILVKQR